MIVPAGIAGGQHAAKIANIKQSRFDSKVCKYIIMERETYFNLKNNAS